MVTRSIDMELKRAMKAPFESDSPPVSSADTYLEKWAQLVTLHFSSDAAKQRALDFGVAALEVGN